MFVFQGVPVFIHNILVYPLVPCKKVCTFVIPNGWNGLSCWFHGEKKKFFSCCLGDLFYLCVPFRGIGPFRGAALAGARPAASSLRDCGIHT